MKATLAFCLVVISGASYAQDAAKNCKRDASCTPQPSCLFEPVPPECDTVQGTPAGIPRSIAGPLPGVIGGMNTQSITNPGGQDFANSHTGALRGMDLQNSLKDLQLPHM